jgi:hypothetical protein
VVAFENCVLEVVLPYQEGAAQSIQAADPFLACVLVGPSPFLVSVVGDCGPVLVGVLLPCLAYPVSASIALRLHRLV